MTSGTNRFPGVLGRTETSLIATARVRYPVFLKIPHEKGFFRGRKGEEPTQDHSADYKNGTPVFKTKYYIYTQQILCPKGGLC
jgi:hypothetical protein